eukprot:TRINITY_DN4791_c0_g1_i1.p1 TRINITY_DN4791_c0_g1~~TRINITY_DN4791_c0_g1_i1.p1  ORF type:complete len:131 (+),score=17.80 TRINITY_DN4791_c0_g1_i1:194-586(+)
MVSQERGKKKKKKKKKKHRKHLLSFLFPINFLQVSPPPPPPPDTATWKKKRKEIRPKEGKRKRKLLRPHSQHKNNFKANCSLEDKYIKKKEKKVSLRSGLPPPPLPSLLPFFLLGGQDSFKKKRKPSYLV